MSFPKTGKLSPGESTFAAMVSSVLRGSVGDRPASIKLVARWTGAGERTVKNWFAGTYAPRGHHFRDIVRNCPAMLDAFLVAADRDDRVAFSNVNEACDTLRKALDVLERLAAKQSRPPGP